MKIKYGGQICKSEFSRAASPETDGRNISRKHAESTVLTDRVRIRAQALKEGRFFKLYATQFEEYGKTWEEIWRGKPLINTIEPANVQKIAALGFEDFGKDPERAIAQSPFLGPGIASDGTVWKHAREMVKPIFSRAEISDIDHFTSFADKFMDLLPNHGRMIDVQPLIRRLVSLLHSTLQLC